MAMDKEVWKSISEEEFREYLYADGPLRIDRPTELHISTSTLGGHAHRIKTADGFAYYVKPGWRAIRWKVLGDNELFKF